MHTCTHAQMDMLLDHPQRTACAEIGGGSSSCSSCGGYRGGGGGGGGEEGGRKAEGGGERERARERVGVNERETRRWGLSPSPRMSATDLSYTWRGKEKRGGEASIDTDITDTDTPARTPANTNSRMCVPDLSHAWQERECERGISAHLSTGIGGGGHKEGRMEVCVLDFGHVTPLMRAASHGHSQAVVSFCFNSVVHARMYIHMYACMHTHTHS
jgi:hypothetical protein